jgi:hypothetical protein
MDLVEGISCYFVGWKESRSTTKEIRSLSGMTGDHRTAGPVDLNNWYTGLTIFAAWTAVCRLKILPMQAPRSSALPKKKLGVWESQHWWSLPTRAWWFLGACLGLVLTEGVAGCPKIKRSIAALIRLNFHGIQSKVRWDSKIYVKGLIYMICGLTLILEAVTDLLVNWRTSSPMNLFEWTVRQEDHVLFD